MLPNFIGSQMLQKNFKPEVTYIGEALKYANLVYEWLEENNLVTK